jgi:hypothetical protein
MLVDIRKLTLKDLMTRHLLTALTASALLMGGGSARADFVTYDTTASWDGTNSEASFGGATPKIVNTATYGETFVGPSGQNSILRDFAFHVSPAAGVHLQFTAYVYAWTGSLTGFGGHITGSALYTGPAMTLDGIAVGTFQTVNVVTGSGIVIAPGAQYVAFLTVSNPVDFSAYKATGVSASTAFGLVATPRHPGNGGGGFVYDIDGSFLSPTDSLFSTWDTRADFGDLAWTADLQPVPEPSALVLSTLAAGTIGLVAACRRATARRIV